MQIKNDLLVSVIIPAFNAEMTIEDTLLSVLNQTWKNIEVIIVDDGSTDNTKKVISKYIDDFKVKYIFQENKGCSNAKNTGLKFTRGNFIQYLDADDVLSIDKIELQVKSIHVNNKAIAICRTVEFIDKPVYIKKNEIDTEFLYSTDKPFEFLLNLHGINGKVGMIQPNAFLIPRHISDIVGEWDESISPSPDEDGEYFCRVLIASSEIIYSEQPINYYRKGLKNSLSRQISYNHIKGSLKSVIRIKNNIISFENSERVRLLMARKFSSFQYQFYGQYPDLSTIADEELKNLGYYNKIPIQGGVKFNILGRIIGVRNAIKVKHFLFKRLLNKNNI